MACIVAPKLPIPTLPFPFTATPPAIPTLAFNPKLCCNLISLSTPPLHIPLPPLTLNPAIVAGFRAGVATVLAYVNALQIPCPRDP